MSVRELEFSVSSSEISPCTVQFAGRQYEHKATKITFELDSELYSTLSQLEGITYRVDINNGEDNYFPSESIEPVTENGKTLICHLINYDITKAGGLCKATLVATAVQNGKESFVYCSAPALIEFSDVDRGTYHTAQDEINGLSGILNEAKGCMIATANVDTNGNLIITYVSGAVVNAGLVQLPQTDTAVRSGGTLPVQSGAVYDALLLKQNNLSFDNIPTLGSNNPVKSNGIAQKLAEKQNLLTFDSAPTPSSANPVVSGGVYTALQGKEDKSNMVTDFVPGLTHDQYMSAKTVFDNFMMLQSDVYSAIGSKEDKSNKVTTVNNTSTDTEYPTAKAVNNAIVSANMYESYKGKTTASISAASDKCVLSFPEPTSSFLCELSLKLDSFPYNRNTKFVVEGCLDNSDAKWYTLLNYAIADSENLLNGYLYRRFTVKAKIIKGDGNNTIEAYGISLPSSSSSFNMSNSCSHPLYSTIRISDGLTQFYKIRVRAVKREDVSRTDETPATYPKTPLLDGFNTVPAKEHELSYFVTQSNNNSYWNGEKTKFEELANGTKISWGNNGLGQGAQCPVYYCYRFYNDFGVIDKDGITLEFNSYKPFYSVPKGNPGGEVLTILRPEKLPLNWQKNMLRYSAEKNYTKGDYAIYNDEIFVCKTAVNGAFNPLYWQKLCSLSETLSCIITFRDNNGTQEICGYRYKNAGASDDFTYATSVFTPSVTDINAVCQFGIGLSAYCPLPSGYDNKTKFVSGVPVLKFDTWNGKISLVHSKTANPTWQQKYEYETLQDNIITDDLLKFENLMNYPFAVNFAACGKDYLLKVTVGDSELLGIVSGDLFRSCNFYAGQNNNTFVSIFGALDRDGETYSNTIGSEIVLERVKTSPAASKLSAANNINEPTLTAYFK